MQKKHRLVLKGWLQAKKTTKTQKHTNTKELAKRSVALLEERSQPRVQQQTTQTDSEIYSPMWFKVVKRGGKRVSMVQNKAERVSWKDDRVAQAHIVWAEPDTHFEAGSEQVLYETRAMAKALSSWMAYSKAKRKAVDKFVLNWHRDAAELKRQKDFEMVRSEAAVAHVARLSGHWLRAERERLLPGLAAVHEELIAAVQKIQAARVVKLKSESFDAKLVVDCIAAGDNTVWRSMGTGGLKFGSRGINSIYHIPGDLWYRGIRYRGIMQNAHAALRESASAHARAACACTHAPTHAARARTARAERAAS